jgi:hypothetical protein
MAAQVVDGSVDTHRADANVAPSADLSPPDDKALLPLIEQAKQELAHLRPPGPEPVIGPMEVTTSADGSTSRARTFKMTPEWSTYGDALHRRVHELQWQSGSAWSIWKQAAYAAAKAKQDAGAALSVQESNVLADVEAGGAGK